MKKIVLFLHGYGSNGSDLITLKDYFHLNQSETEFISPNAPEPCEFNYFGYQWFALNERSVEEIQTGLKSAFFYLDDICLLYTSPSPRDVEESRMPSSA